MKKNLMKNEQTGFASILTCFTVYPNALLRNTRCSRPLTSFGVIGFASYAPKSLQATFVFSFLIKKVLRYFFALTKSFA